MIAIFDSGIGGFDVLRRLPSNLDIFYFADTKNFPYGNKTADEIFIAVQAAYEIIKQKNVTHIILACNTASIVMKSCPQINEIPTFDMYSALQHYSDIENLTIICTEFTEKKIERRSGIC